MNSFDPFVQLQPQLVERIDEPVDTGEVLRYLGYPSGRMPSPRIEKILSEWIPLAQQRATPRATFTVLPVVECQSRRLAVQSQVGQVEFEGAVGKFLGMSQLLVAFIATAGPGVESLASQLMSSGEEVAAMIVNAVGAERAEAAESAVIQRVRKQVRSIGFDATLPYSPGYCGMKLAEQRKLFSLFGHVTAGVELTAECLMKPIKSVSGLVGLAPADQVDEFGSPCVRCELHQCNMRR